MEGVQHSTMTPDDATDALEATLDAIAGRDWDRLSELLIDVRTTPGEHPSADELRKDFQDVKLEAYKIEELTQIAECRADAVLQLTRTGYGRDETDIRDLTLFRVGDDGQPDPDGRWTVTNPIVLRAMPAE